MHSRVSLILSLLGSISSIAGLPQVTSLPLTHTLTTTHSISLPTTIASPTSTSLESLPSSLTSASIATPPVSVPQSNAADTSQPKLVVAHVIVGNTQPYGEADWAADIALASAAGIDAFALNYGSLSWEPGQLSNAYAAAASNPNFKLFLSADMTSLPSGSQGDAQTVANQIATFANNPAQLKFNGKTLLSTFSGENSYFGTGSVQNGWQSVLSMVGTPVAFMPAFFVDPSTFGNYPVIAGALNWNGAWPTGSSDITFDSDNQWISGLNGKAYIAPISPNFFTHYSPQTYNKNFIYRSDDNLYATRWEMLMQHRSSIAIVEIITWNDFGESHYIGPIKGDESMANAWVDGYDHTAWLDMTSYYATAFKTGAYPAITKDKVYIYGRPHPKNANANDPVGRPSNYQSTDDNFYVLVLATAPGTVVLSTPNPSASAPLPPSSGPNAQSFAVTEGANMFKLALSPFNGMRATLQRGSATIVDVFPTNYMFNPNPPSYNFNAFVAMAST